VAATGDAAGSVLEQVTEKVVETTRFTWKMEEYMKNRLELRTPSGNLHHAVVGQQQV